MSALSPSLTYRYHLSPITEENTIINKPGHHVRISRGTNAGFSDIIIIAKKVTVDPDVSLKCRVAYINAEETTGERAYIHCSLLILNTEKVRSLSTCYIGSTRPSKSNPTPKQASKEIKKQIVGLKKEMPTLHDKLTTV